MTGKPDQSGNIDMETPHAIASGLESLHIGMAEILKHQSWWGFRRESSSRYRNEDNPWFV